MTIIADHTIKALSHQQTPLIHPFSSRNLGAHHYDLTIDSVIIDATRPKMVKFSTIANLYLEPNAIAWFRMSERLSLPHDIVAELQQTDHFSKFGLSILNLSKLSSDYTGYVTCVVANLSGKPMRIRTNDVIARLIFWKVERSFYRTICDMGNVEEYDRRLEDLSARREGTFLDFDGIEKRIKADIELSATDTFRKATWSAAAVGAILIASFTVLPIFQGLFLSAMGIDHHNRSIISTQDSICSLILRNMEGNASELEEAFGCP